MYKNVTMNKVPFTCLLFKQQAKKKNNIRSAKLLTRRVNKINFYSICGYQNVRHSCYNTLIKSES